MAFARPHARRHIANPILSNKPTATGTRAFFFSRPVAPHALKLGRTNASKPILVEVERCRAPVIFTVIVGFETGVFEVVVAYKGK